MIRLKPVIAAAALTIGLSVSAAAFWTDIDPTSVIDRFVGRVLIGAGADNNGNYYPPRGDWLAAGADWAARDATLLAMAPQGNMAIVGASRTSDDPGDNGAGDLSGHSAIGVGGFLINDKLHGRGWAAYLDVQHEAGADWSTGVELAIKNKGTNVTHTPYSLPQGVTGLWVQGGGDPTSGGAAVNPAASFITLAKNPATPSVNTFNAGIVFGDGSLTGDYGTMIAAPVHYQYVWYTPDGGIGASLRSDVNVSGHQVQMAFGNDSAAFYGANGQVMFVLLHVPNGVNQMVFSNAVAGQPPSLSSAGPDANIDLKLIPKGSGRVRFGTFVSAPGVANVSGYIWIKESNGTARKLAVLQ